MQIKMNFFTISPINSQNRFMSPHLGPKATNPFSKFKNIIFKRFAN